MVSHAFLQLNNVGRSFNGVKALQSISLELNIGEVLGLAGHNGAGKSTLLNILSGDLMNDTGTMTLGGARFSPNSPGAANAAGVFRIHQELAVIENLTVAENLTLGTERHIRRFGMLTPRRTVRAAEQFLEEFGLGDLHASRLVDRLTLAERQLLEIAKALYMARLARIEQPILLLDEPTSGLTQVQVDFLESHLATLRQHMGIILTTHRGSELLEWSDRIAVLRDGQLVAEPDPKSTSLDELSAMMVGTSTLSTYVRSATIDRSRHPLLEVTDLTLPALTVPASLSVHPGEVVALIGESDEKTQIARFIAGLLVARTGSAKVEGRSLPRSVRGVMKAGIRFVPADRGGEGLALLHSVTNNLSLSAIAVDQNARLARNPQAEKRFATELVTKYAVKVARIDQPAGSLSGGNQQKLLVAKALSERAKVIVLDKPTRGIDVQAKSEIFRLIVEASTRGVAVVIASDEPEDLLQLCDRILAFRNGELSAEFMCRSGERPTLADLAAAIS